MTAHGLSACFMRPWPIAWLCLLGLYGSAAAAGPAFPSYTVSFDPPASLPYVATVPPIDGASANASFAMRAEAATRYEACGQENQFLSLVANFPGSSVPDAAIFKTFIGNAPGIDDVLRFAMAKLEWLQLHDLPCTGTFKVPYIAGDATDFYNNPIFANETLFSKTLAALFNTDGHAECGPSDAAFSVSLPTSPEGFVTVSSRLSAACLQRQINVALQHIEQGSSQPGTDGLPCNIVGKVQGDWDMRMKGLIRIIFLDQTRQTPNGTQNVLSHLTTDGTLTTRQYILQQLISIDGEPGPDTYSWTACGDNEKDTGSPQDRDDDNDEGSDLLDSIGDAFTWLFRRLILIAALLTVAGVVAAVGGLVQLAFVAAAAAAVAAILAGQIPETENHRLMIESTRFLNNQVIISELSPDEASALVSAQTKVKTWLLKHIQLTAKNDFIEYNSRPYHGLAVGALQNLAQFSSDIDVRNGAQMLIEYSAAKFAIGSNQDRRLVPFRRHFAAVDCIDGNPCPDLIADNVGPADMFDQYYQVGDTDVSEGLLFYGQTQQQIAGNMSVYALNDAYSAATGRALPNPFLPNSLIADLAIRKDAPHLQRIHHAGFEIFSSGPSALITAGGIETPHAYDFTAASVPIGALGTDNQGSGVPTTVIFTGNPNGAPVWAAKMSLDKFISFRGTRKIESGNTTFTDNLCVWKNVACGVNIYVPKDILQCLEEWPRSHWIFFNSSTCTSTFSSYGYGPQFFFAMYVVCNLSDCKTELGTDMFSSLSGTYPPADRTNAGFIEVADNAPGTNSVTAYQAFKNKILSANPSDSSGFIAGLGAGCLPGSLGLFATCDGHIHTFSGHDLELNLLGHRSDSNRSGVESVDGSKQPDIGDWPLSQGDFINSSGDGVIAITNPRLGSQVILDFSDLNYPCRRLTSLSPCVQQ